MPCPKFRGLVSALVLITSNAIAQPAPTPEEVQQAQARWSEGKTFFDAGNFEAARVAFKQAYTIFPHPVFLQNLGEAELRVGRHVDAARHFEAFLRTASSASGVQRELAKKSLKKASETLASLIVQTNTEDAEIRVDDEVVGRSPLAGMEWYVKPGRHVVVARKEGYLDGSEQVFATAGAAKTVVVRVQRVVGDADDARGAASAEQAPRAGEHSPEQALGADRTSLEPRTLVLAGGAVLTVAALTLGTIYAVRVGSDQMHLNEARAQLTTNADCADPLSHAQACDELARYAPRLPTDRNARNAALVAGGVLGAATVATLFLWSPAEARSVPAAPGAARAFGVGVSGWFSGASFGAAAFGTF
jgi:hypothetical protein